MDQTRRILWNARLAPRHRSTGRTRHWLDGELAPTPSFLQIVQYEGDNGFYLLYLNEQGDEITDTWHQTLDDAFRQAEFEFTLARGDWKPALN